MLGRRERRRLEASGPVSEHVEEGFWYRWSRSIERQPALRALGALLVVVVIALPVFSLRLGLTDAGSDPSGTTTRLAYDLLAKGFGPGFNGPLELVTTLHSPAELTAFEKVTKAASTQTGVVYVTPPRVSPTGNAAVALVYPSTAPQAAQTSTLLHTLRQKVIPSAEAGSGLHVLVGGATAGGDDFSAVLASKLALFIAVVVVVAFLLLMLVFRSLLIPAVASVMNLLSVGAALGIMNAVFEWGWGHSILGISRTGPVEVFIPVIMFSVLFGLSMDYEVFLVSRMREEWVITHDNREAVTKGQTETGRVITAAALIMILVFLSFLLGGNIIIQQFGIGLAGAIIIDAFIIRTVAVPAIMHLIGKANWWLPGFLDQAAPPRQRRSARQTRRPSHRYRSRSASSHLDPDPVQAEAWSQAGDVTALSYLAFWPRRIEDGGLGGLCRLTRGRESARMKMRGGDDAERRRQSEDDPGRKGHADGRAASPLLAPDRRRDGVRGQVDQAGSPDGRGPRPLQGPLRHLRAPGAALPAPPRRPLLRLRRGVRASLQLPRLGLRRGGQLPLGALRGQLVWQLAISRPDPPARLPRRGEGRAALCLHGPDPAPLCPTWESFTWPNGFAQIVLAPLDCNWLQAAENNIDPVHFEWLHSNWSLAQAGKPAHSPDAPAHRGRRVGVRVRLQAHPRRRLGGRPELDPPPPPLHAKHLRRRRHTL